jgi:polyketide cyclase/dehydrase/lipid transport protein
MQFTKTKIINTPTDRVWKVVAHDFDRVGDWSSAVAASSPNTDTPVPDGATVGGRVCVTPGFGDLTEAFTDYSEDNKEFVYEADGLPSFVTLARNHITVRPAGTGRSEVQLEVTMETKGVGKVMGPMLAIKMKSTLDTFLDELAAYVELGEISRKKTKQLAKAGS